MNSSSSPPEGNPSIVIVNSSNSNGNIVVQDHEEQKKPCKKVVRYKECLKNHAAAIGGSATDGCGEFMPSGEEGSIEALRCSACNCHRNFHRKEIECDAHNHHLRHHQLMVMLSPKSGSAHSASDEKDGGTGVVVGRPTPADDDHQNKMMMMRKRFRTKFTQEQKEKMLSFAVRADWRIQKLDESVVQQFCQEIGIKRRVLKVWMHNNKHSFAKKNSSFDN